MRTLLLVSALICAVSAFHHSVVCPRTTELVQCPAHQQINIIHAHWGRNESLHCTDGATTGLLNYVCEGNDVTDRVRDSCNGKKSCEVSHDTVIAGVHDPCTIIHKYVHIRYQCDTPAYGEPLSCSTVDEAQHAMRFRLKDSRSPSACSQQCREAGAKFGFCVSSQRMMCICLTDGAPLNVYMDDRWNGKHQCPVQCEDGSPCGGSTGEYQCYAPSVDAVAAHAKAIQDAATVQALSKRSMTVAAAPPPTCKCTNTECITYTCVNNECVPTKKALGTACNGGSCDGSGVCQAIKKVNCVLSKTEVCTACSGCPGTQTCTYPVETPASGGGTPCPPTSQQSKACTNAACAAGCKALTLPAGAASSTCGAAVEKATCQVHCTNNVVETATCNNGNWVFTACSVTVTKTCAIGSLSAVSHGTWGCSGSIATGQECPLTCESGYNKNADAYCVDGAWAFYGTNPSFTTQDDPCECDYALVLDQSLSIGDANFKSYVVGFATQMVENLKSHLGPNNARVSIHTFNTGVVDRTKGLLSDYASLTQVISSFNKALGDGTQTYLAIPQGQATLEQDGRPLTACRRMVVVTDGASNECGLNDCSPKTIATANTAKASKYGIEVFCYGVTDRVNEQEIQGIASVPTATHSAHVENFNELNSLANSLTAICASSSTVVSGTPVPSAVCTAKVCTNPQAVANGVWQAICGTAGASIPSGTTCTVTCSAGYVVSGGPASCSVGTWSNLPMCVESVSCPGAPTAYPNGVWSVVSATLQQFHCNSAPTVVVSTATCGAHGWVINPTPNCPAPSCGAISGTYLAGTGSFATDCTGKAVGSMCTLTCIAGYAKSGDATCVAGASTATWTQPQCIKTVVTNCDVTKLAAVTHGTWSCTTVANGGSCPMVCAATYTKTGDAYCVGGEWILYAPSATGPPSVKLTAVQCVEKACTGNPTMAVANGYWACANMASGATCQPTCNGLIAVNEPIIRAAENIIPIIDPIIVLSSCNKPSGSVTCVGGTWTVVSTPACLPAGCTTAPVIANGVAKCASGSTASGGSCPVTCNAGFTLTGALTCNQCSWSAVTCSASSCAVPPLVVNGSFPNCQSMASGSSCTLVCNSGFQPGPVKTIMCSGGAWTPNAATCLPANCAGLPGSIANGVYPSSCSNAAHGAMCTATCSSGYTPSGSAMCEYGKWTSGTVCGAAKCNAPLAIANGKITCATTLYEAGTVCNVVCNTGYMPTVATTTCEKGLWTPAACALGTCPPLPMVLFGTWPAECTSPAPLIGAKCSIDCAHGYTQSGGPAVCSATAWTNVPVCKPNDCTQPPAAIVNGRWLWTSSVTSGSFLSYTCSVGYNPLDPSSAAQCINGAWVINQAKVACVAAPCTTAPANPANGAYATGCVPAVDGATCKLNCNTGFNPSGVATCVSGAWHTATCNPVNAANSCKGAPTQALVGGHYDTCTTVLSGAECKVFCGSGVNPTLPKPSMIWSTFPYTGTPDHSSVANYLFWMQKQGTQGAKSGYCVNKPLASFTSVNNAAVCGGGASSNEIVTHVVITIPVTATDKYEFRMGLDGAYGNIWLLNGKTVYSKLTEPDGVWWTGSWTNQYVETMTLTLDPGTNTIEMWETEQCCDGGQTVQYMHGGQTTWQALTTESLTAAPVYTSGTNAVCNNGVYTPGSCTPNTCTSAPTNVMPDGGKFPGTCADKENGYVCPPTCPTGTVPEGGAVCTFGTWVYSTARCLPGDCAAPPTMPFAMVSQTPMCVHAKTTGNSVYWPLPYKGTQFQTMITAGSDASIAFGPNAATKTYVININPNNAGTIEFVKYLSETSSSVGETTKVSVLKTGVNTTIWVSAKGGALQVGTGNIYGQHVIANYTDHTFGGDSTVIQPSVMTSGSVSGDWYINCNQCVTLSSNSNAWTWLPFQTNGFTFNVQGSSAGVVFAADEGVATPTTALYYIDMTSTGTTIRRSLNGVVVASKSTPDISASQSRQFFVSAQYGIVQLSSGNQAGHNVLLEFTDPSPLSVHYAAVSTPTAASWNINCGSSAVVAPSTCGNGKIDAGETCESGGVVCVGTGTISCDACTTVTGTCTFGYVIQYSGTAPYGVNWQQAEDLCKSKFGTHLASIHSLAEANAIGQLMNMIPGTDGASDWPMGNKWAWLGANDNAKAFTWVWSDGTPYDYSTFGPNQPDNSQQPAVRGGIAEKETCLQTYLDTHWNDAPCSYNWPPYICSYKYTGTQTTYVTGSASTSVYDFPTCGTSEAIDGWCDGLRLVTLAQATDQLCINACCADPICDTWLRNGTMCWIGAADECGQTDSMGRKWQGGHVYQPPMMSTCPNPAPSGTTCSYSCPTGYSPSGTLTCTNSVWSPYHCDPNPCTSPPAVENGVITCTGASTASGSSCSFACKAGTTAVPFMAGKPTNAIQCEAGQWVNIPSCKVSQCPTINQDINNGMISGCASLAFGATCAPKCNPGYTPSGNAVCSNGVWELSAASCLPASCTTLPVSPAGATITGCALPIKHGGTCVVPCSAPAQSKSNTVCEHGTNTITCATGTITVTNAWYGRTDATTCIAGEECCLSGRTQMDVTKQIQTNCDGKKTCSNPVENTWFGKDPLVDTFKFSVTTYNCGATDIGPNPVTATCSYGKWNPISCVEPKCGAPPAVADGVWPPTCTNAADAATCQVTCDAGYEVKGGPAKCVAPSWTIVPSCQPLACTTPPAAIEHGIWLWTGQSTSGTTAWPGSANSGTKIPFMCQPGYVPVNSSATAMCLLGKWQFDSTEASCSASSCMSEPTAPANGKYESKCASTVTGGTCVLTCNSGYSKTGDAMCTRGVWSSPTCVQVVNEDCKSPPPAVANGVYESCTTVPNGATCNLQCITGYTKTGDAKCVNAVYVTPAPTCTENKCTTAPSPVPANGMFPTSCATGAAGATCAMTCNPGYTPQGVATCHAGKWDTSAASCQPSACPNSPMPAVANSESVSCGTSGSLPSGAMCTFTCKPGYTPSGTLTCTNGKYSTAQCLPATCTSPPTVANGMFEANCKDVSGSNGQCQVVCEDRYTPSTPYAVCTNGAWSKVPTCTPMPCAKSPADVANGKFAVCTNVANGGSCVLTCNPGYTKSGNAMCMLGQWDTSAAICTATPCTMPPPSVPNLLNWNCPQTGNTSASGTICHFACQPGYTPNGQASCVNGQWTMTGAGPVMAGVMVMYTAQCTESVCDVPPTVENGHFQSTCANVASGSSCTVTCNTGYIASPTSAMCSKGAWTTKPVCSAAPCEGAPSTIDFGMWTVSGPTPSGHTVPYTCSSGYVPVSPTYHATCTNGQWVVDKALAACSPAPCETAPNPSTLLNGFYATGCAGVPSGDKCAVMCNPLYNKTADAVCTRGTWSIPQCVQQKPSDCKTEPAKVANGAYNCGVTASGGTCVLECDKGYRKNGDAVCNNGAWSTSPACSPMACTDQPTAPANGHFAVCANAASGAMCVLTCNPGYTPSGSAKCNLGEWEVTSVSCKANGCSSMPTSPTNGKTTCTTPVESGMTCGYECSPGYVPSGSLTCTLGTWSNAMCAPASCEDPPTVANGKFSGNCYGVSGNSGTCLVTCNQGYEPYNPQAVCTAGKWTSVPECRPSACASRPTEVVQGTWQCNGSFPLVSGSICTLSCSTGYTPSGPGTSTCTNGAWSQTTANQCTPSPCKTAPTAPADGTFPSTCVNVPDGAVCVLTCSKDYVKSGDSLCAYGKWQPVQCIHNASTDCTTPPTDPAHGTFGNCQRASDGASCPLTCDAGYTPEGDAKCNSGRWSTATTPASCVAQNCASPPSNVLTNGEWPAAGSPQCSMPMASAGVYKSGTVCTPTCNSGYTPSGSATCTANRWTVSSASCVPKPCTTLPPLPTGGVWDSACATGVKSGGSCSPSCGPGYIPTGGAVCNEGSWTVTMAECLAPSCDTPPVIVNGAATASCYNTNGKNGTCTPACNSGYELNPSGPQVAVCSLGKWTSTPTCVPKPCASIPSAVEFGTWSCKPPVADMGTCALTCSAGYTPSNAATCSSGTWKNIPVCNMSPCPSEPTAVANGKYATCVNVAPNGDCVLTCDSGYTKTSNAVCNKGSWIPGSCVKSAPLDCMSPPPQVPNGVFLACSYAASGSSCTLQCTSGYTPGGNALCNNGQWNTSKATCSPSACPQEPANPEYGQFASGCGGAAHGKTCALTCNNGYTKDGDAICTYGKWSLTEAVCQPKACSAVPMATHGAFPNCPSNAASGSKCSVVCTPPYEPVGTPSAECLNGNWVLPVCGEPSCAVPPLNPTGGKYSSCTNMKSGSVCSLACNPGYTKTGDAVCRNGTWGAQTPTAKLPTCDASECKGMPNTTVVNGKWGCTASDETASGKSCALVCNEGYTPNGDAVCNAGQWEDIINRQCVAKSCVNAPKAPAHGEYESACTNVGNGGVCMLVCDSGYTPSNHAVCQLGVWTVPTCEAASCTSAPTVLYGTSNCMSASGSGGTCAVSCNVGYQLLESSNGGGTSAKCTNGKWSYLPKCEPASCTAQPSSIPNGKWSCTVPVASAGMCNATCDSGFTPTGPAVCSLGKWSIYTTCNPKPCTGQPGTIANGNTAAGCNPSGSVPSGSSCMVTCNSGYVVVRESLCVEGTWSPGSCTQPAVTNCAAAPSPNPMHGEFDNCQSTPNGQQCALRCNTGYTPSQNAVCTSGKWNTNGAVCNAMPCVAPPVSVIGSYGTYATNCANAPNGFVCDLKCNAGYVHVGDAVCQLGRWDTTNAICTYEPCNAEPQVVDGSFPSCKSTTSSGGVCSLVCNAGYYKSGDAICTNGTWSKPTCKRMCASSPINPQFGTYETSCTNAMEGASCRLTCNSGYSKTGDAVCTAAGLWNGTASNGLMPTCQANPCTKAPSVDPANGAWTCKGTIPSGGSCNLQCKSGYAPTGSAVCNAGAWSGSGSGCEAMKCASTPPAPANGQYATQCAEMPSGSKCPLTCNTGYQASDEALCELGVWSTPVCTEAECTSTPAVPYGHAVATCLTGICTILCNEGYVISGTESAAVCSKGQWSFVPTCVAQPCKSAPTPVAQGTWQCSGAANNGTCALKCSDGFTKSADALCMNGKWSAAECLPSPCKSYPKAPQYGSIPDNYCINVDDGSTCPLTCQTGYVKSADFSCTRGQWSSPVCRQAAASDCAARPTPNPQNGQYDACNQIASGGSCALTCNKGYTKTSDAKCTNGIWTLGACVAQNCTGMPPNPPQGVFSCSSPVASGGVCTLSCSGGLVKNGEAYCANGQWNTSLATCSYAPCTKPLNVPNGVANCSGVVASGTQCKITCNGNYTASGMSTCVNGAYTPVMCNAPGCVNAPPSPVNGAYDVVGCSAQADGYTCMLKCNPGYSKTGDAMCNKGSWEGEDTINVGMPTCKPQGCSGSPNVLVQYGSWLCKSGLGTGDACQLSCSSGYTPSGNALCVGNAWQQTAQACLPAECALAPSAPINGGYKGNCTRTPSGGSCELLCNDGYTADSEATCKAGLWSQPSCVASKCSVPPIVANGAFETTCKSVAGTGGTCLVTCNPGFKASGDASAVCKLGQWAVIPVCVSSGCKSAPNPVVNGVWSCSSGVEGASCNLQCSTGYKATGQATCIGGVWQQAAAVCSAVACASPPAAVVNGTWASGCGGQASGSTCVLTCASGYSKTYDAVCNLGVWSTGSLCRMQAPNDCMVPPVAPSMGSYHVCTGVPSGGSCPLTCAAGYVSSGNAVCYNGTWSVTTCTAMKCTQAPEASRVQYSIFTNITACVNVASGFTCAMVCQSGYLLTKSPWCNLGSWDYTGVQCAAMECTSLPVLRNATAECTLPVTNNGVCKMACDPAYLLVGQAVCSFGQWNLPTCQPLCVHPPTDPSGGTYQNSNCLSATSGTVCKLQCNTGYSSTNDLVCRSGTWVANNALGLPMPVCQPNSCKSVPPTVEHGTWDVACANSASGSSCKLTCASTYVTSGGATTCTAGLWSVDTMCVLADPCAGVNCTITNSSLVQCSNSVCQQGKCLIQPKSMGTPCNNGNPYFIDDTCDGQGSCQGIPNLCYYVECPFAETECQQDGLCNMTDGSCYNPPQPDGTPCTSAGPGMTNQQCIAGQCVGIVGDDDGIPYPSTAYIGHFGTSCCLIFTVVADTTEVSAVEVYATDAIPDMSQYYVVVKGVPSTDPSVLNEQVIRFPNITLQQGQRVVLTSNTSEYEKTFGTKAMSYYPLPQLDGTQQLILIRLSPSMVKYQVDTFPLSMIPGLYPWANGYAHRDLSRGWVFDANVFAHGTATASQVPFGKFSIMSSLTKVVCGCNAQLADSVSSTGQPLCLSNTLATAQNTFSDSNFLPSSEFGTQWLYTATGQLVGMNGKWNCTITL